MFLKNSWYVAAFTGDLQDQVLLARQILGEKLVIWRTAAGDPVVFEDRCPHRFVPLSAGRKVRDTVQCGYHGMRFGKDGRCVAIPGQAQIPPTARVPSYPVVEKYGLIWVWMGDAATATVEMIPDLPWMEEAAWVPTKGYTYIRADYRLLNDNLLDLSHESYIHEGTIGNDETDSIAEYPLSVTVEDGRVIRAHRDMINIDPPPFFAMILETEQKIDRWQAAIWAAPAINITDVGVVGAGLPHSAAYINRVLHLITPETETSSHYFWALCRNYRLSDAALGTSVHAALAKTFHEDKVMLELQQEALLNRYERSIPGVATKLDDAPLRARRILSTLIKQESESH